MSGIEGLNWRLMLGSAAIPPIFVLVLVYMSPESPRWYMYKGRLADSYHAMAQLRNTPLQAARDVYLAYEGVLVEREASRNKSRSRLVELFTVPRIRKGTQSASFVMFMQQFCGVNVGEQSRGCDSTAQLTDPRLPQSPTLAQPSSRTQGRARLSHWVPRSAGAH